MTMKFVRNCEKLHPNKKTTISIFFSQALTEEKNRKQQHEPMIFIILNGIPVE